jgi:hypothetical protein
MALLPTASSSGTVLLALLALVSMGANVPLVEANFKARYKARYQHLADPNCEGPPPTIQLFCLGSLNPVSISDASIRCSALTSTTGGNGIQCTNSCEETGTCETLYVERDEIEGGVFGEIIYECEGETAPDIDTYMEYLGGGPGSCEQGSNGRNFHVGQLGVLCPSEGGADAFVFRDQYFECALGSSVTEADGAYTCITGDNCGESNCTVEYEDMFIEADGHKFRDCIQSTDGDPVPEAPSDAEYRVPSEPGFYTAKFEANWRLSMDESSCGGSFVTKIITCLNGEIDLIETKYDNVNCTMTSGDTLECTDTNGDHFVNAFSGVTYVSGLVWRASVSCTFFSFAEHRHRPNPCRIPDVQRQRAT